MTALLCNIVRNNSAPSISYRTTRSKISILKPMKVEKTKYSQSDKNLVVMDQMRCLAGKFKTRDPSSHILVTYFQ